MTHKVGNVLIDNTPINLPKRKLIIVVAFITSFILAIFLAYLLSLIKPSKDEEESNI
jgi:hypothetical protein